VETRIKELGYIEQMRHITYMALWEDAQNEHPVSGDFRTLST
jgi:hypothetical protein